MSKALIIQNKDELNAVIERNKQNGWEDLTAQRKAFAMYYVTNYNARKAAEKAQFSAEKGASLTREPLLSAYIAELQSQDLISNIVTEDFVRTQWLNMIPILSGQVEIPLGVNADGDQLNGKQFNAAALNATIKELAKTTKIYEEGSGGSGQVNVQINVGALLGDNIKDV